MKRSKATTSVANAYLVDDYPEIFHRQVAVAIGLTEAIVLQKIHYWVQLNTKKRQTYANGFYWTYNTMAQWQAEMPWWSERTIRTALTNLRQSGLVVAEQLMSDQRDRTFWYRVDHGVLERILRAVAAETSEDRKMLAESEQRVHPADSAGWMEQKLPPAAFVSLPDVDKEQRQQSETTTSYFKKAVLLSASHLPRERDFGHTPVTVQPTLQASVGTQEAAAPDGTAATPNPPMAPAPPAPSRRGRPKKAPAPEAPAPTPEHQALVEAMAVAIYGSPGNTPKNMFGRIGAAAKQLRELDPPFTPEQLAAAARRLTADSFWTGKLTPEVLVQRLPQLRPVTRPRPTAPAPAAPVDPTRPRRTAQQILQEIEARRAEKEARHIQPDARKETEW